MGIREQLLHQALLVEVEHVELSAEEQVETLSSSTLPIDCTLGLGELSSTVQFRSVNQACARLSLSLMLGREAMMNSSVADVIREAAELSKSAPNHLQEAAFNKAFDALFSSNGQSGTPRKKHRATGRVATTTKVEQADSKALIDSLNRTNYPQIDSEDSAFNNSLRLLLAARDDLGVDGLSAAQLAKVLTSTFRCRCTRQAISQVLNPATKYVHRHKDGGHVLFQIMGPGEKYLATLPAGGAKTPQQPSSKSRDYSGKTTKTSKVPSPSLAGKTPATAAEKRSLKKREPLKDIGRLQSRGFFKTPRTISQIISQLKDQHGRPYKPNELSTILLRLLRNETLTRSKNKDHQYEYKEK